MGKHTPAFLALAVGYAKALLLPARGRHSARRIRSTRVRRYAPVPAPALAAPPASRAPRLAPPSHPTDASDVAPARPYLDAHEHELAAVQALARVRLRTWTSKIGPAPSPPRTRPHRWVTCSRPSPRIQPPRPSPPDRVSSPSSNA